MELWLTDKYPPSSVPLQYSNVLSRPFATTYSHFTLCYHHCNLFPQFYHCRSRRNGGGVVIVLKPGDLGRVLTVNNWPSIQLYLCFSPALCDIVYAFLSDCRYRAAHGGPMYGGHTCVMAIKVHTILGSKSSCSLPSADSDGAILT